MRDEVFGIASFLAVADKRSFTAAASEFGVTPSAISQVVRQLEQRLGIRLLHRTTRSVGLTEAGERLYTRIKPAFGEMKLAIESLDELRERPTGLLRLNVSRLVNVVVFEPVLGAFLAKFPDIKVEISIDDGLADIVGEGFDAGVRLGETLDKEMIAVSISPPQRMAVVASPSYFAARAKPKHPRDLLQHDCIRYRQVSTGALYKWEFDEAGKPFEIALDGRVIVNDAGAMLRACLDGLGVAHLIEARDETLRKSGARLRR